MNSYNYKAAEITTRINRGMNLVAFVKNGIYVGTALKLLFETTILTAIIMALVAIFIFFLIGYADLKYFKLFQAESDLAANKYNPHLRKINKLLKAKSI